MSAERPLSKFVPCEFSPHCVLGQMSLQIPYMAICIILMRALILHYLEMKYLGRWKTH